VGVHTLGCPVFFIDGSFSRGLFLKGRPAHRAGRD